MDEPIGWADALRARVLPSVAAGGLERPVLLVAVLAAAAWWASPARGGCCGWA